MSNENACRRLLSPTISEAQTLLVSARCRRGLDNRRSEKIARTCLCEQLLRSIRSCLALVVAFAALAMSGCEKNNVAKAPANPDPAKTSTSPGNAPDESMRVRKRLTRRADGVLDLTFDDLEFEIERDGKFQRDLLGEKIESYVGKSIVLRGFILGASVFQQKGIKQFVLVRDNQECCFGPGAYLFHNAQVELVSGQSCDFSIRQVTVEGKLAIRPFLGPNGKCYSVFHITAERVKL